MNKTRIAIRMLTFMMVGLMAFNLLTAANGVSFRQTQRVNLSPLGYHDDIPTYLDDPQPVGVGEVDYNLTDSYGGVWYDAEKTNDNTDDDLMCWAAAASNVLQWTGWGYAVHATDGAMTNCDEMFAHFNAHWEDQGSLSKIAWMWWFNGDGGLPSDYPDDPPYNGGSASWSEVDVAGGGDFWTPPYNIGDYMHEYRGSNTLQNIDDYLRNGWGVALGIYNGGHAITCWGFRYNSSINKATNPADYYLGLYITDSDDSKNFNSWDPPPDRIRYYDVSYNTGINRWEFDTYGGGGWHIEVVYALEPFPNSAPVAEANGPYTGTEGSPITFDGSGSSDPDGNPLMYRWDFNNDGSWDTAWSTDPLATYTYPDDYSGLVVLEVSDRMASDTDTATVTVSNVAPTVNAGSDKTSDEGATVSFSGSFSDPGTGDTHTISWDFGDGHTSSGTLTPTHVYGDDGVYTVTLTVTDDDGGIGTDTLTVTVSNVAPTITPFGPFTVNEGTQVTLTASSSDPGSDDLTYTWVFQLGPTLTATYFNDGSAADPYPSPDGTYPFSASDTVQHTYGDNYVYTVTLTVTDDDGGSATYSTTVTVNNVAPAIIGALEMTSPNPDNPEFILPTVHTPLFKAKFTDAGTDDLTFTWNWGDGTQETTVFYNDGSPPPDALPSPDGIYPFVKTDNKGHTYAEPGTYTVTLTVTDDDGGSYTTTYTIKILSPEEAKHVINDIIQALPNSAFRGQASQRKNAFNNMFAAIDDMLAYEEYQGAIMDLKNNIRSKMDGHVDGSSKDDWIINASAQEDLCWKIDALIAYLETLL